MWTPLGDQILVRPLLPPDQTSGGLVIPDEARARPQKGVVVAVGAGLASELTGQRAVPQCAPGDLVLFGQYAGVSEDLDGEPLLIMRDQEALARKPQGEYALVEHQDPRGRVVAHLAGETCEHCPKPAPASLEHERARLREGRKD